ncbi:MAG: ElyC/SanA/YdcF family protein [Clostridia bacterium]|jgi:vancomycin permeability regulator SanA|nr:ElyC/SanA/YdcF family protein [Clostridia bacterium]
MRKRSGNKKSLKGKMLFLSCIFVIIAGVALFINNYVQQAGLPYISEPDTIPEAEAVLILGARVYPGGNVSLMLNDRLITGLELYEKGKAPKIIVSGDHGQKEYDEVNAMKSFLKERDVPAEDIFMDHAGFSTYESLYRARDIFQVKKVIIVTQRYHLLRALFIARELGLEAYGVASDKHIYHNVMLKSELREIAARNKDFITAKIVKPRPQYLGEVIPVTGDGRVTDDQL